MVNRESAYKKGVAAAVASSSAMSSEVTTRESGTHRIAGRNVLLTGATGYIGSALGPRLVELGARLTATARGDAHPDWPEVAWRRLDLAGDEAHMKACCEGQEILIHMAALRGETGRSLEEVRRVNAEATRRLHHAALEAGVKEFFFVSTVGVCGFQIDVDEETPYDDEDDSPYHRSKVEAERFLLARPGFERLVIVRPCVVYGEGRTDGFVWNLTKLVRTGAFAPIGRTSPDLEMVHIDNLLEGFDVILARGEDRQAYIITDGQALPVHRIGALIAETLGKRLLPVRVPVAAARLGAAAFEGLSRMLGKRPFISRHKLNLFIRPQTFNISKVKRLGYAPVVDTETALRRTVSALAERLEEKRK